MEHIFLTDTIYPKQAITHERTTVRAILINHKEEFAFLRVVGEDDFGIRNHLETLGGGVDDGEDFEEALKRECMEEAGLKVRVIRKLIVITDEYHLLQRRTHSHFYLCELEESGFALNLQDYETMLLKDVKWLTYHQAIVQLESEHVCNIGQLIHRRDVIALKQANHQVIKKVEGL